MPEDIQLDASKIVTMDNFTYFGNNIIKDGEVAHKVGLRLGKATRTIDCFVHFGNQQLSVQIRMDVYHTVVLFILMYGVETWMIKAPS